MDEAELSTVALAACHALHQRHAHVLKADLQDKWGHWMMILSTARIKGMGQGSCKEQGRTKKPRPMVSSLFAKRTSLRLMSTSRESPGWFAMKPHLWLPCLPSSTHSQPCRATTAIRV